MAFLMVGLVSLDPAAFGGREVATQRASQVAAARPLRRRHWEGHRARGRGGGDDRGTRRLPPGSRAGRLLHPPTAAPSSEPSGQTEADTTGAGGRPRIDHRRDRRAARRFDWIRGPPIGPERRLEQRSAPPGRRPRRAQRRPGLFNGLPGAQSGRRQAGSEPRRPERGPRRRAGPVRRVRRALHLPKRRAFGHRDLRRLLGQARAPERAAGARARLATDDGAWYRGRRTRRRRALGPARSVVISSGTTTPDRAIATKQDQTAAGTPE